MTIIINYKKIINDNEKNKKIIQVVSELNKIDEFYDSYQYIKNKKIKIDSFIINEYELAQINNGIKRQIKTNIKRMNLLYRATRDGGKPEDYISKCQGCKNLLTVVITTNGRKFGGFSSLRLQKDGGAQKDNTAFIFSLDLKENYYIKKNKTAFCFRGSPCFGQNWFNNDIAIANCFDKHGCCDYTGGKDHSYDYENGRKHFLVGKYNFTASDYEVFELEFVDI